MKIKKWMLLFLTAVMMFSLVACGGESEFDPSEQGAQPGPGESGDPTDDGWDILDHLQWEVTEDGIRLTNYTGDRADVVLPDTIEGKKVVSLGTAFAGNVTVETLVLGQHIDRINGEWLEGCGNLKRLEGPAVEELVGEELDVDALEELILPALKRLDLGDIEDCESLRVLQIPNVGYIRTYDTRDYEMHRWPAALEEVVIPEGMLLRAGGYYDWDDENVLYQAFGGLALAEELDEEADEDAFDCAAAFRQIPAEQADYCYCNLFQQQSVTVNGVTYSYSE